jgi:hypothetical protein
VITEEPPAAEQHHWDRASPAVPTRPGASSIDRRIAASARRDPVRAAAEPRVCSGTTTTWQGPAPLRPSPGLRLVATP